jgi:pilus assembly protein CpaE
MATKPLLLAVCASPELRALLDAVAGEQSLRVAKINQYLTPTSRFDLTQFPPNSPLIAFVDFTGDPEQGIKTAEVLSNNAMPRIWTVAVSNSADPDIVMRAMSAGCCEYLRLPATEANIDQTLSKIMRRVSKLDVDSKAAGAIAVFIGVRGGTGATTLAVHTALACAREPAPRKVLLVDLKRQLGHVPVYLNIANPGHTFAHALMNVDRLDGELLQSMLVQHSPNLSVLCSPDDCSTLTGAMARQQYQPAPASEEAIDRVLDRFRSEHDLTIFDADAQLPETVAVARRADHVFIVASLDIASMRDVARYMDTLGRDLDRQKLIITRVGRGVLTPAMVASAAGIPIVASFPDLSEPITSAINAGTPIPRQVKCFYESLAPVLTQIGGMALEEPHKRSFFGRRNK